MIIEIINVALLNEETWPKGYIKHRIITYSKEVISIVENKIPKILTYLLKHLYRKLLVY